MKKKYNVNYWVFISEYYNYMNYRKKYNRVTLSDCKIVIST